MAARYSTGSTVSYQEARGVVDTLVQTIERKFRGFNISEIVEGGSLGHGTAVASNYDIDLVIYSRGFTGRDVQREGKFRLFKKWLIPLRDFLEETFGRDYRKKRMTKRSVQFRFKDTIDVDLLVSPYWENQHQFYEFLKTVQDKEERESFSVGASKWQVQFFKKQPPQVKEYTRKAKEWRNQQWPKDSSGSGRPSSYLMSLLVVMAYERNPNDVTAVIKDIVRNGDTVDKCWAGPGYFYEKRDYPSLLPSRPRIVDPANPANNVWSTGLQR